MTDRISGNYPLERRAAEFEWLRLQGETMPDCLPATVEALRCAVTGRGLMDAAALDADPAARRTHLADPDTVFPTYVVAQAWGRTPGG